MLRFQFFGKGLNSTPNACQTIPSPVFILSRLFLDIFKVGFLVRTTHLLITMYEIHLQRGRIVLLFLGSCDKLNKYTGTLSSVSWPDCPENFTQILIFTIQLLHICWFETGPIVRFNQIPDISLRLKVRYNVTLYSTFAPPNVGPDCPLRQNPEYVSINGLNCHPIS